MGTSPQALKKLRESEAGLEEQVAEELSSSILVVERPELQ